MTSPNFSMLADGSALEQGASALLGNAAPSDHDLLGWTYDPLLTRAASGAPVSGTLYLAGIPIRTTIPIVRKVWWINAATGATLTASQNFAGLVRPDGIVAGSVGIDAKNTAGAQSATLTNPVRNLLPGLWFVGLFWNGSAKPTLAKIDPAAVAAHIVGLTDVTRYRFATNAIGLTTAMPGSIALSSNDNTAAFPFWAGIST